MIPRLSSRLGSIAAFLLATNCLQAQVAVYRFVERSSWTGQGAKSSEVMLGAYVFDLLDATATEIAAFPASKNMRVSLKTMPFIFVSGSKGAVQAVTGNANSWEAADPNIDNTYWYQSYIGTITKVSVGGSYPKIPIPKSFSGPILAVYENSELGARLRRGTQMMRFDAKTTKTANDNSLNVQQTVNLLISDYERKGYVLQD